MFVIGINDHAMYASGAAPRLVGRKVNNVADVDLPESVEVAKAAAKGAGELRYTRLNPVARRQESKITCLERIGDYAVGVGYTRNRQRSRQALKACGGTVCAAMSQWAGHLCRGGCRLAQMQFLQDGRRDLLD